MTDRIKAWAILGCLALVAAGPASERKPEAGKPAVPAGSEAKAETVKAEGSAAVRVELVGSDGLILVGTYRAPKGVEEAKSAGILLLHQMRGKRQDWAGLTAELVKRGYAVLAMDLRGHGDSVKGKEGKEYDHRNFRVEEFPAMVGDAEAALAFLSEQESVDPDRIAIVGASIGANAALNAAAKHAEVRSVVLLSPGLEYRMVKTEPAMEKYEGAVFLAASEEDRYSTETVRKLKELCRGKCELKIYAGAGHGTNMFRPTKGDLETRIVNWIDETLKG